jgi:hypothetical protein
MRPCRTKTRSTWIGHRAPRVCASGAVSGGTLASTSGMGHGRLSSSADGAAGLPSAPEMPCAPRQLRLVPIADIWRTSPNLHGRTLQSSSLVDGSRPIADRRRDEHKIVREVPKPSIGQRHSITSSARIRIDRGTVRPSALAVLRFTMYSNVVGCSTGKSEGFVPLRILSM